MTTRFTSFVLGMLLMTACGHLGLDLLDSNPSEEMVPIDGAGGNDSIEPPQGGAGGRDGLDRPHSNVDLTGGPVLLDALDPEGPGGAASCDPECTRTSEDLLLLYRFDEGAGTTAKDTSGKLPPLDLAVPETEGVLWGESSIVIKTPTFLKSKEPASRLKKAAESAEGITIEVWLTPANVTQDGPARFLTISSGGFDRNLMIAQEAREIWVRLRTTDTDANGEPNLVSPPLLTPELTHIVYTWTKDGLEELIVNGKIVALGKRSGTLTNWTEDFYLAVAGELDVPLESRDFQGSISLIALYARALDHVEIARNYLSGPD